MTDKPEDKADIEFPDPEESAPMAELGSQDSLQVNDDYDSDLNDEEDGDDEEEFSLDQLSQAYAAALKTRGESPEDVHESEQTSTTEPIQANASPREEEEEEQVPEIDDDASCSISPESIIESILFVGAPKGVTLNSRKIAAVLRDVSPKEVTQTVRALNAKYEKENAAFRIESDGGVFKMKLDPALVEFQQEFFGRNRQVRLSQAAIDVMAIVAYNQPATKDLVEKIRLKPSGGVLAQLVRRELLVVEAGESNSKIKYYSTTDRFLDLFQLEELADLPQSHDVSDMDELAD
ncbi:SMC-Scp complex subunit ScpB [Mariniblastus sp.]|nr:SMC-Scp complex subunit ScpB [Mariniblastus sp.]